MADISGKSFSQQPVDTVKKQNIPIMLTDGFLFDENLATTKERFGEMMQRIDNDMIALCTAITTYYTQNTPLPEPDDVPPMPSDNVEVSWEDIVNSPLVIDEGGIPMLQLQFDVSQFSPSEVRVITGDDLLTVTALHQEKTDTTSVYREFTRTFPLPKGTNVAAIESAISKDGILIVKTPLIQAVQNTV